MVRGANREDALFRPRLFLVSASAAKRAVEPVRVERLLERLRFHDVGVQSRPVSERIDAHFHTLRVGVHQEIESESTRGLISERDHLPEFPCCVDVEQREREVRRMESLHRQVQHYGAVLADGIEHHGALALGDDLAHDVDALGFQPLQDGQVHQNVTPSGLRSRNANAIDSAKYTISRGMSIARFESLVDDR